MWSLYLDGILYTTGLSLSEATALVTALGEVGMAEAVRDSRR